MYPQETEDGLSRKKRKRQYQRREDITLDPKIKEEMCSLGISAEWIHEDYQSR